MRKLLLMLLTLLLAAPPVLANDPNDADPDAEEARTGSGPGDGEASGDDGDDGDDDEGGNEEEQPEPEEPVLDEEGEPLDEDDLVEVRGLVYEFFIADDAPERQLGVEAADRDYLIAPGREARALAMQLGKTVTVKGWAVPDEAGDLWLTVEEFRIED